MANAKTLHEEPEQAILDFEKDVSLENLLQVLKHQMSCFAHQWHFSVAAAAAAAAVDEAFFLVGLRPRRFGADEAAVEEPDGTATTLGTLVDFPRRFGGPFATMVAMEWLT